MRWKTGLFGFIGLILLFLMTSKAGIEPGVSNNLQTKDAAVGEDVTLDCHVGPYLINFIKSVEWKFNGEVNVLVYKSKDFSLNDQGGKFRVRASGGDRWDFKGGELPVKISPLQESDAGNYSCSVSIGLEIKEICSIKLNVKKGKKPMKDDVPQPQSLQGRDPKGFRDKVQTQDAAVGEDVTLDCHVGSDLIVSIKTVEWRFNGEVNVLVYKSKGFSLDDQGKQFRGRASKGDSWDFKTGKLPVKIKSLQESDAGNYSCSVSTGEDPKEIISIKLNVNEAVDKDKQAKDQSTNSQSSSPVILILCLLWFWQRIHY